MRRLFRQFSFPGGIPSHVAPETPGSIHEGGELGYALVARLRRRVRQPGPARAAASSATARRRPGRWPRAGTRTSSSIPRRDGAVLPILHLNGYKIANPTVLARIPQDELRALLEGYGHAPRFVEGDDPDGDAPAMAATLDDVARRDRARSRRRRAGGDDRTRPRWPMIVLRTPKGWTGPKEVDGKPAEGTWRSHQVPLAELARATRSTSRSSRSGCAATGPRSCSTSDGAPRARARARSRPRATGG